MRGLLIALSWIAIVWFCVAYVENEFVLIFTEEMARVFFVLLWPVMWIFTWVMDSYQDSL